VIGGKGRGHLICFIIADLYWEAERFPLISLVELVIIAERVAIVAHSKRPKGAERVGFEPTVTTKATTVFETAPIGRSGTSPSEALS
jgi:hypothetical protein